MEQEGIAYINIDGTQRFDNADTSQINARARESIVIDGEDAHDDKQKKENITIRTCKEDAQNDQKIKGKLQEDVHECRWVRKRNGREIQGR